MEKIKEKKEIVRPPVVVIMGHIDHGKSTLLDYIRKTKVVEKEAGGITQHVSAYEVEIGIEKRKITFLDTPGHEAFCSIRERGSKTADIAVLVVSAEDGVKQQTIEALNCIKKENLPYVVAINKIDKAGANPEKTKQDLAGQEVLVEGWGGTIPVVAISAKTGQNVDELLEILSLQADILEFKADQERDAEGFVVESHLDSKIGTVASLVIKNGTLKRGMYVATKNAWAPVKMIENFDGKILEEASVCAAININNWSEAPTVGSNFASFQNKEEALDYTSKSGEGKMSTIIVEEGGKTSLLLCIKADTQSSLEAIFHEIDKINKEFETLNTFAKEVCQGIGTITEKDVKSAISSNATIIGFNVKTDKNAIALSLRDNIEIKNYSIIYELTDWVKSKLEEIRPESEEEKITGTAKILKIFNKNKNKQVVGGKVESGEIKSGASIKIIRRETEIGTGKIKELQTKKEKVGKVEEGSEFGMMIDSITDIVAGDSIKSV